MHSKRENMILFVHEVLYDFADTSLKYRIGYDVPEQTRIPSEYNILKVPVLTWAIFPAENCQMHDV